MKGARVENRPSQVSNSGFIFALLAIFIISCRNYKGSNVVVSSSPAAIEYSSDSFPSGVSNGTNNFTPGQLKIAVPTEPSDLSTFSFQVQGPSNVNFYAWKLSTDGPCYRRRDGYKIEAIKSPLEIDLGDMSGGFLSLCVIAFDSSSGLWQSTQKPDVFTWRKIPFVRTLKSFYIFGDCGDGTNVPVFAETRIEFNGNRGKSDWFVDFNLSGCGDNTTYFEGTDSLTIKSNTPSEISGFYSQDGSPLGGWFKFEWLDKERTKFKGSFGTGDIGENPIGKWNTDISEFF